MVLVLAIETIWYTFLSMRLASTCDVMGMGSSLPWKMTNYCIIVKTSAEQPCPGNQRNEGKKGAQKSFRHETQASSSQPAPSQPHLNRTAVMISRLAVGLARAGAARVPTPALSAGLYATRPRTFAYTRSLAKETQEPRDPKSEPEDSSKKSTEPEEAGGEKPTGQEGEGKSKGFPLPDLTQGIPSTLEYEAGERTRDSLTRPPGEEGRRELPESAYVSSFDRRRESFAKWAFILALAGAAGTVAYMGREFDEAEREKYADAPAGWSPTAWWRRAVARYNGVVTYFAEPAFEALLPKVDPMLEKPYTLCISLEDMLVHSEWSREHGWRVAKRPGVDYFLRYLSQYYELVLFTTVPSAVALPVIQKLDPFQMIMFPLFREATKYKDGEFVKVCIFRLIRLVPIYTNVRRRTNRGSNRFRLGPLLLKPRP